MKFLLLLILALYLSLALTKGGKKAPMRPQSVFDKKLSNRREELKMTLCNFLTEEHLQPCQNYYISP